MAEFFQVDIVFLVVAIFAKTECYSPSKLLVRSAMCCTSATYQLSTCRKWYVHHSKHSMIILVTKPISIRPVLSLARKASEKILPVKMITQGKSKPNIFSYQSSYWGMSTLAVPVLFEWEILLLQYQCTHCTDRGCWDKPSTREWRPHGWGMREARPKCLEQKMCSIVRTLW